MIGYLGTPGALIALPYKGGLSTETDRPVSFVRTMGGKRKAFTGPRGRREWDVSFDLIGSVDTHGLVQVARSPGEVMWYPADATAGNMFSPQASAFETVPANAADAGLVSLPDGTVSRSVVHSGAGRVTVGDGLEDPPVRSGGLVTVGAWGLDGLRLIGTWRDADGTNQGSWDGGINSFTGWQRHEYTMTVPATATNVRLQLIGGTQYARPVVSWGESAADRPGRGCPKAVVHGLSESLTLIGADDAHGSISVTVTEVG